MNDYVSALGGPTGPLSPQGRANMSKMTTCLWFDHGKAREAAEFYASVFRSETVR
jgi:hypothetical protein